MAQGSPFGLIIEDSAHAVFTIIAASNGAAGKVRKGFNSHFSPWYHARILCMARPDSTDPLMQSMRLRRAINPFAVEFFAQGVLRRLGIRTAEQTICSGKEARMLPPDFIVKVAGEEPAQNLTWNPASVRNGWCLVSRLVPDAVSLDFISRKLITSHSVRTQMLRESAAIHADKDRAFEALIAKTLGKTCAPADKFFADFKPTESEIEAI